MIAKIKIFAKGMCMGIADVIPGVSGGTIALLLGIYEKLISTLHSINGNFIKLILKGQFKTALQQVDLKFLITLLAGIVTSFLIFSKFILYALNNHPVLINSFFFGLVLGTIPIIFFLIKKKNFMTSVIIIISAVVTYFIVNTTPIQTPENLFFVFLSGAIAISAMILPGISGSFILIILNKYEYVLSAVHNRDLVIVGTFLIGITTGIFSFVRILNYLFKNFHDQTLAVLTGLVMGSILKIWPWSQVTESIISSKGKVVPLVTEVYFPTEFTTETMIGFGLMIIGLTITQLLNKPDLKVVQ